MNRLWKSYFAVRDDEVTYVVRTKVGFEPRTSPGDYSTFGPNGKGLKDLSFAGHVTRKYDADEDLVCCVYLIQPNPFSFAIDVVHIYLFGFSIRNGFCSIRNTIFELSSSRLTE